jgi:hypothetical protein
MCSLFFLALLYASTGGEVQRGDLKNVGSSISFATVPESESNRASRNGVSYIWIWNDEALDPLPSLSPVNLRNLIGRIDFDVVSAFKKTHKKLGLMYVIKRIEGDFGVSARGVLIGVEVVDKEGKIERLMYRFDMDEAEFIKTALSLYGK